MRRRSVGQQVQKRIAKQSAGRKAQQNFQQIFGRCLQKKQTIVRYRLQILSYISCLHWNKLQHDERDSADGGRAEESIEPNRSRGLRLAGTIAITLLLRGIVGVIVSVAVSMVVPVMVMAVSVVVAVMVVAVSVVVAIVRVMVKGALAWGAGKFGGGFFDDLRLRRSFFGRYRHGCRNLILLVGFC